MCNLFKDLVLLSEGPCSKLDVGSASRKRCGENSLAVSDVTLVVGIGHAVKPSRTTGGVLRPTDRCPERVGGLAQAPAETAIRARANSTTGRA